MNDIDSIQTSDTKNGVVLKSSFLGVIPTAKKKEIPNLLRIWICSSRNRSKKTSYQDKIIWSTEEYRGKVISKGGFIPNNNVSMSNLKLAVHRYILKNRLGSVTVILKSSFVGKDSKGDPLFEAFIVPNLGNCFFQPYDRRALQKHGDFYVTNPESMYWSVYNMSPEGNENLSPTNSDISSAETIAANSRMKNYDIQVNVFDSSPSKKSDSNWGEIATFVSIISILIGMIIFFNKRI